MIFKVIFVLPESIKILNVHRASTSAIYFSSTTKQLLMSSHARRWIIRFTTTTITHHDNIITRLIIHKFFLQRYRHSRAIFRFTAQHLERHRRPTMEIFISHQTRGLVETLMRQRKCFHQLCPIDSLWTMSITTVLVRVFLHAIIDCDWLNFSF